MKNSLLQNSPFETAAALATCSVTVFLLLSGCSPPRSSSLTVEIINWEEVVNSGDLNIKVCFGSEIQLPELVVNIYVTEREEWGNIPEVAPYTDYVNELFVGVPGTLSQPVDESLWQPAQGTFCYKAILENAFVNTDDWMQQGICPFNGVVVVANYKEGAWNAASVIECEVPN